MWEKPEAFEDVPAEDDRHQGVIDDIVGHTEATDHSDHEHGPVAATMRSNTATTSTMASVTSRTTATWTGMTERPGRRENRKGDALW